MGGEIKAGNYRLNKVTAVLFGIYLIVISWILLFKLGVRFSYMENRTVNLVPFNEPLIANGKADLGEIVMNVAIFVPLGIYAGLLFRRWNIFGKVFCFFLVSFIVESLQFILKIGAFDITDIITNTCGGIIGLLMLSAIERLFNNNYKAHRFINIVATLGTAAMILFLILLKMNMLPIRYQ